MCLLKTPFSWIVILVPLMIFASFMFLGFLSIFFTSTVLIFSTVLFISKKKLIHKPIKDISVSMKQEEQDGGSHDVLSENEDEISMKQEDLQEGGSHDVWSENEDEISMKQEDHEGGSSHDVLSENEDEISMKQEDHEGGSSHDHVLSENEDDELSTTEGSEVDMDRTPDWSDDGSISDEDSLIEISLPGGHYLRPNNKCCTMQQKFMSESIFKQRSLMEILADMNEENLIEIDVSMGSIKYSRFEIEA